MLPHDSFGEVPRSVQENGQHIDVLGVSFNSAPFGFTEGGRELISRRETAAAAFSRSLDMRRRPPAIWLGAAYYVAAYACRSRRGYQVPADYCQLRRSFLVSKVKVKSKMADATGVETFLSLRFRR